ncbi:MAG: hypothetical protein Q9161_008599 [Pseudevernia consocians]
MKPSGRSLICARRTCVPPVCMEWKVRPRCLIHESLRKKEPVAENKFREEQNGNFNGDTNIRLRDARSWQELVNLRFRAKMVNDDDDVKALSCKKCGGLLASLEFVLYRVPPYLVIQWGFEQLRKQAKLQMFDDLIVPNTSPWRSDPKEDIYRWAGLIMLTNINHFELYRRTDEGGVQHVQGLRQLRKQRITSLDY